MLRATRQYRDRNEVMIEALRIGSTIAKAAKPLNIYLFGSVAEGKATDQSDFDFLIVVASDQAIKEAKNNLRPFRPLSSTPIDLIWMTEQEFNRKSLVGGIAMIAREDGISLDVKDLINDQSKNI